MTKQYYFNLITFVYCIPDCIVPLACLVVFCALCGFTEFSPCYRLPSST